MLDHLIRLSNSSVTGNIEEAANWDNLYNVSYNILYLTVCNTLYLLYIMFILKVNNYY